MGRTAIYLVIGFGLIALYFGSQAHNLKFEAMNNAISYYEDIQRYSIANAGANFAIDKICRDTSWHPNDATFYQFADGRFSLKVKDSNDVFSTFKIITIKAIRQTTDDNTGEGIDDITYQRIIIAPSSFAKFAYFASGDANDLAWSTNDTVYGPYHANILCVPNSSPSPPKPTFMDKVTTPAGSAGVIRQTSGTIANPLSNYANFKKGVFKAFVATPTYGSAFTELKVLAKTAGHYDSVAARDKVGSGRSWWYNYPTYVSNKLTDAKNDSVWLTFYPSGRMKIKMRSWNWPTSSPATPDTFIGNIITKDTLITEYASNGVIYFEGFDVFVHGKLNGRVTVVSSKNGASGTKGGKIYIDSSLVYANTVMSGPGVSDDMIGLVAQDSVLIGNTADNNCKTGGGCLNGYSWAWGAARGVDIHAVIFSLDKGFGAQWKENRSYNGAVHFLGGMAIKKRTGFKTGDHGFDKVYRYDQRLLNRLSPPGFPETGEWEIISWLE